MFILWAEDFRVRIVYRGGSYDALMGAANTKMDVED